MTHIIRRVGAGRRRGGSGGRWRGGGGDKVQ